MLASCCLMQVVMYTYLIEMFVKRDLNLSVSVFFFASFDHITHVIFQALAPIYAQLMQQGANLAVRQATHAHTKRD